MQPNVIKKSWTTCNIASTIEDDHVARRSSDEASTFQSRDLIREYLLKARVPEILKTAQGRNSAAYVTSAIPSEVNFAYKHPLVAAEELMRTGGETLADDIGRKLSNVNDNSSIIVPKTLRHVKKSSHDGRPHLVGKVTASIAKTWEQLTHAMDSSIESPAEEEDEDKQSYTLFVRKPFSFQQSDEIFDVNKIQHEAGEQFFDSIDHELQFAEDEYDDDETTEGGEVMAEELDSLEMRCNDVILWSIES
jgi:hypothetical protein